MKEKELMSFEVFQLKYDSILLFKIVTTLIACKCFSFRSDHTTDIIDNIDLDLKGEYCDDIFH